MPMTTYDIGGLGARPQADVDAAGIPAAGTESNREDLLDAVINLDYNKSAALFLAAPKTTANGMNHEWLVDTIPATATGGSVEGATWSSSSTADPRYRLGNYVQTLSFPFAVTKDQIEYSLKGRTPGVSNEYEHQVNRHLLTLEQSVDARAVALGTSVAQVVPASNATALFGAIRSWHASGSGTQGLATATALTATAASSMPKLNVSGAWNRTYFLNLHEFMYGLGANPDTLAVDPGVKMDITLDVLGEIASASATNAGTSMYGIPAVVRQQYTMSSPNEFHQDIQFMRTPFGRIAVLVDRFIPTSAAAATNAVGAAAVFLYERSKLRFAFWRPMRHYALPPTGDHARGYVHCGVTLEVLHPQTCGVLYNITT